MKPLLAAMLVAYGLGNPVARAAQAKPPDDIRITSAIFGMRDGSADVTPMVVHLAKPGLDEFYAAPFWLEVDPVVGQNKTLVVFYEYRGQAHVVSTSEPGAMSHAILVEHANPVAAGPPAGDSPNALVILNAFYGRGRTYAPATSRVRELIRPEAEPFQIDDAVMEMRPTAAANVLVLTYEYRGRRQTVVAWQGERVSYARLVAGVQPPGAAGRHTDIPPAWIKDARPFPPRQPGNRGPGVGRAPRRELAISELRQALAELQAIPADDRVDAVTRAVALTTSALANAERNLGYPFTSAPAEARRGSTADHLAGATMSLSRALTQLSGAGPGRGAAFLTSALSDIKAALAELAAVAR